MHSLIIPSLKAQEDTTKKIKEKAPGAKIKEVYNTLFSGFSISVPGDQITALASLPEVKAVYPNLTYKLHETSKVLLMKKHQISADQQLVQLKHGI